MYIRRYTSPNENFEYGYPHSNALLQFRLKFERCKPHNTASHPTKYDIINDVKLFPAVYRRIYCRKFLTLSNQKSGFKSKCILMVVKSLLNLFLCINPFMPKGFSHLYQMDEFISNFRVVGCFFSYFCKQTVETLIRCHIMWHLIWVCAVCLCPTKQTLGLYGFNAV